MAFKMTAMESFSFDGETIGAAGAAALRRVKTLSEQAPRGRLFASIATLTEMSSATAMALEQGELPKATHVAAALAKKGEIKMPNFFKRKA